MSTQTSVPVSPLATLSIQNAELANHIQPTYTLAELEALRKLMVAHNTLTTRRYPNGGHSAVTVLDTKSTLYSALEGLLYNMWDRDNIMQALAELTLSEDAELRDGLDVAGDDWRKALDAALVHHKKGDFRFIDIILGRASGYSKDYMRRPHIRYNPISLAECGDAWGHGQNDSLSFVNFMLFHALRTGRMQWDGNGNGDDLKVLSFATLTHAFFWQIHCWEDFDLGAWEDCCGQHWSSIACVLVSLREQLAYMKASGQSLNYNKDGKDYFVTANGVQELIDKCAAKLAEIGVNEFITADGGGRRDVDLAMLNPMLLACFAGQPVVDDANTVAVLEKIEAELVGHIGIRRYAKDIWDGRENRDSQTQKPGEEAQWVHGAPQMSYIYGDLYQRTGDERYFEKQVLFFNRALASIAPSWLTPEAWIIDPKTGNWVPDANEPLAWATSMFILAFAGMKKSLTKKNAAVAA